MKHTKQNLVRARLHVMMHDSSVNVVDANDVGIENQARSEALSEVYRSEGMDEIDWISQPSAKEIGAPADTVSTDPDLSDKET